MSAHTPWGPRPGESNRQYMERLNDERLARQAIERGEPAPEPPPPPLAAAPDLPPDDIALARQQAEATARSPAIDAREARSSGAGYFRQDVGRSAGSALPPLARAVSGQRIEHLRIHETDLRPIARATPAAQWRAVIRKSYELRPPQGFAMRAVAKVVDKLLWIEAEIDKGTGYIRRTAYELGRLADYCERHVKRITRDLEARGLMDVLNTLKRDGAMWVRGANVYVPTVDAGAPPLPADVDVPDPPAPVASKAGGGARLSALFGLALRPWGLNTSPLRTSRDNLAPA